MSLKGARCNSGWRIRESKHYRDLWRISFWKNAMGSYTMRDGDGAFVVIFRFVIVLTACWFGYSFPKRMAEATEKWRWSTQKEHFEAVLHFNFRLSLWFGILKLFFHNQTKLSSLPSVSVWTTLLFWTISWLQEPLTATIRCKNSATLLGENLFHPPILPFSRKI